MHVDACTNAQTRIERWPCNLQPMQLRRLAVSKSISDWIFCVIRRIYPQNLWVSIISGMTFRGNSKVLAESGRVYIGRLLDCR